VYASAATNVIAAACEKGVARQLKTTEFEKTASSNKNQHFSKQKAAKPGGQSLLIGFRYQF
jgi:hypothetical protein